MKTLSQRTRELETNLQNVWIAFYNLDPGDDPENNDEVDPIVWVEGTRFNLPNWEITSDGIAYNLDELTVTNSKEGEASKIKHLVIWDSDSGGESKYKLSLINQGALMIKTDYTFQSREIIIKEE